MDKIIEGFENYTIDEYGNIKNNKTNRKMKQHLHSKGYFDIELRNNNSERRKFLVHRLVAKYFIDNYSDDMTVDHIDNNRQNNFYQNLECVSLSENIKRSINRKKERKNKFRISKEEIVKIFKSKKWENVDLFFEQIMKH